MTPSPRKLAKYKQELIAWHKQHTLAPAKEVLEHIYTTLRDVPAFTLKDGTKATVTASTSPNVNDRGEVTCELNVNLDDGSDLTFTVSNSGWGKWIGPRTNDAHDVSPANAIHKTGTPPRQR